MKIFESHNVTTDDSTFNRYQFLWIFSLIIGYQENHGSHLYIGLGLMPFEISTQLTIWSFDGE
jgi:hypothetical protein